MNEKDFYSRVTQHIKVPIPAMKQKLDAFLAICSYVSGQYDSDKSFQELEAAMNEKEKDFKGTQRNRIFYMALPPSVFTDVAQGLKKNNVSLSSYYLYQISHC